MTPSSAVRAVEIRPSIFREYDIRGIAGRDLTAGFAEVLGLAYAKYVAGRAPRAGRRNLTVAVGMDCRVTSDDYASALARGMRKGGLDVIRGVDSRAPMRLAKLGKGEVVGEMAFYTGGARTASTVASARSGVYVLHKDALTRMRTEHADLATRFDRRPIGKIADSLARTNRLMGALS
jgi:hypothetical protein